MQKIISILGVISAVLFATAPQFTAIQPKTAAILTLIGTVATAASGALIRFGISNIYVTVIGVLIAVISVLAGANDIIPGNVVTVLTIAGTAIAALGKSLFGIDKDDDDDDDDSGNSVIGSSLRGSGLSLIALILAASSLTACNKDREFVKTMDRAAGYIQTGLDLVEYQADNNQISPASAIAITSALQSVNTVNGELIAETKNHLSEDGKSLKLNTASKAKLLAIVESSKNVAINLLSNPQFTSLPEDKRVKYTVLIRELTATIDVVGQLINAVKTEGGK